MKQQIIIWNDCTHYDDAALEVEAIKAEPLIEMQTIGFVIAERDDVVCLGMEYIPDQNRWRHVTWIPKCNILKRIRLS